MATESHGNLKQDGALAASSRTRPPRMWMRNSLGRAVMRPQRFIFSGSSSGLPARHPSGARFRMTESNSALRTARFALPAPASPAPFRRFTTPFDCAPFVPMGSPPRRGQCSVGARPLGPLSAPFRCSQVQAGADRLLQNGPPRPGHAGGDGPQ